MIFFRYIICIALKTIGITKMVLKYFSLSLGYMPVFLCYKHAQIKRNQCCLSQYLTLVLRDHTYSDCSTNETQNRGLITHQSLHDKDPSLLKGIQAQIFQSNHTQQLMSICTFEIVSSRSKATHCQPIVPVLII